MNDKEYIEFLEGKEKTQTETVNFLIKENEKLNNALNGKITAYKCREVDKLQSNWNSLREWLEKHRTRLYEANFYDIKTIECVEALLDKMNKLEGKNN